MEDCIMATIAHKMSDEEKGKVLYQVIKMMGSATGYTISSHTDIDDIYAIGRSNPVASVAGNTITTITIHHMEDSLAQQVDFLLKQLEAVKEQRDEYAKQLETVKKALGVDEEDFDE
jgi:hypothetical protein